MLRCQEEVVMLVEESPVEGNKCLPVVTARSGVVRICGLCSINLYTLGLNHGQASVDGLDLRFKLFSEIGRESG